MTTLQAQLRTAALSDVCKRDLGYHIDQIELHSAALPKIPCTAFDNDLPDGALSTTFTRQAKILPPTVKQAVGERLSESKGSQSRALQSVRNFSEQHGTNHFKTVSVTYRGYPSTHDPFRAQRSRAQLSGKEEDFVYRCAEALTHGAIERPPAASEAAVCAVEAYKTGFRKYTGRDPTSEELKEVDRLYFGFDDKGNVGVIQGPHSCFPHFHVTCRSRPVVQCTRQVYPAELPPIRKARDRFPGPIPVWSSTKNLYTMVGNDLHSTAYQHTSTSTGLKRTALRETMTASK